MITECSGNLFDSEAVVLVNAVNCDGIMGKGIALQFKHHYPAMYADYVRRCYCGYVHVGKPYLWRGSQHNIVNLPTKLHWRGPSKPEYIRSALEYLRGHLTAWKIVSLAVPALGCGNGGLLWSDCVRPMIYSALQDVNIPVFLYPPKE